MWILTNHLRSLCCCCHYLFTNSVTYWKYQQWSQRLIPNMSTFLCNQYEGFVHTQEKPLHSKMNKKKQNKTTKNRTFCLVCYLWYKLNSNQRSLKIRTKIKDIQQRQKSPSYISAIDNSIHPATHSSEIFCLHNKNSQFFSPLFSISISFYI